MENPKIRKTTRQGNLETVSGIARIILFHNLKDIPVTRSLIYKWLDNRHPSGMSERSGKKAIATLKASGILKTSNTELILNQVDVKGNRRRDIRQLLTIDFVEMLNLYQKYIVKDIEKTVSRFPVEIQGFLVSRYLETRNNQIKSEMEMAKELLDKFGRYEGKELSPAEYFYWNWQSTRVIEYLKAWNE